MFSSHVGFLEDYCVISRDWNPIATRVVVRVVRSNIARPNPRPSLRYSSNNVLGPLSEERYIVDSQKSVMSRRTMRRVLHRTAPFVA